MITNVWWVRDIAEPHPNIPTREYYKHINGEIVEPRRMMQLLVWCGKKALEATERRNQGEGNAYAIGMWDIYTAPWL